jgi:fructokinase
VMLSAVGNDPLGDEMLAYLADRGLNTGFVSRHPALPTGTVTVVLSDLGQPSYTISEHVAWDDIAQADGWRQAAEGARALVFGSLAARAPANRSALEELLNTHGLLRVMDVNLRAPYDDRDAVLNLAGRTDWLKLNEEELSVLTGLGFDRTGEADCLISAIRALGDLVGCRRICVTRGERGAILWDDGAIYSTKPPAVVVADAIGAGDAFTAAFVFGLLTMPDRPQEIIERACALGGLVASLPGGQPEYDLSALEVPGFGAGC